MSILWLAFKHRCMATVDELFGRKKISCRPKRLHPDAARIASDLMASFEEYQRHGQSMMEAVKDLPFKGKHPKTKSPLSLSKDQFRQNVKKVNDGFVRSAQSADPDELAAVLIDLFCVGFNLDDLDMKRRLVAVWSAILAPAVVMREAAKQSITLASIVDDGINWLRSGCTESSISCLERRDTQFIAQHPASIYRLIDDQATSLGLDHEGLMVSMISPLVSGIGTHLGAQRVNFG